MTGSGKTGLGVVLLEEILRSGRPALILDPKGDLANLALLFPDLAPADFRPWIDAAEARRQGVPGRFCGRSRP
jgi:DNA helicase HerA-like ATPase